MGTRIPSQGVAAPFVSGKRGTRPSQHGGHSLEQGKAVTPSYFLTKNGDETGLTYIKLVNCYLKVDGLLPTRVMQLLKKDM
ncbi:uncharacterized protein G2W53_041244 [Senna tora]|uniref:Uncharacterized protein n=1 Tax=Senna tora TaxID=362788 RepID=A0A834SEJ0_9FABA|nr:uncharacterized protein G2W53_041244 [Senna tora]